MVCKLEFKTWLTDSRQSASVETASDTLTRKAKPPVPTASNIEANYEPYSTKRLFNKWANTIQRAELTAFDTETNQLTLTWQRIGWRVFLGRSSVSSLRGHLPTTYEPHQNNLIALGCSNKLKPCLRRQQSQKSAKHLKLRRQRTEQLRHHLRWHRVRHHVGILRLQPVSSRQ